MKVRWATTYGNTMLIGRLICKVIRSSLVTSRNPARVLSSVGRMMRESCSNDRYGRLQHYKQVDGMYYWHPHIPGYPSPAFDRFLRRRITNSLEPASDCCLYSAYIVITGSCPLHCEHCFEHDAVTCDKTRSEEDVLASIEQIINLGAIRISLTGGEPITRLSLVHRILQHFQNRGVQFWINTSAAGLTAERIRKLKQLGLNGITFSLDHHDESAHDQFRGYEGSYRQVVSSAKAAVEMGLITELSLCATNDFISEENLESYMRLATNLGTAFIQILEPRPVGKYAGCDVDLIPHLRKLLESFYGGTMKSGRRTADQPLISYPDYHNRRYGCDGGKYHLYVDNRGNASPCPFCRTVSAPLKRLTRGTFSQMLHCPHTAATGA